VTHPAYSIYVFRGPDGVRSAEEFRDAVRAVLPADRTSTPAALPSPG
jgi:hypothetical protein